MLDRWRNIRSRGRSAEVDSTQDIELIQQFLETGNDAQFGLDEFGQLFFSPGIAGELIAYANQCLFLQFLHVFV